MTIGYKFTLWVSVVVIVIGLASGIIFYQLELHKEMDLYEAMGQKIGKVLEKSIASHMMNRHRGAIQRLFTDIEDSETVTGLMLIDRNGVAQAGTDQSLIGTSIKSEFLRCHGCHERGQGAQFYRLQDTARYVQHVSNTPKCHTCHDPGQKFIGAIVIDFSVADVEKHIRHEMLLGYLVFIPTLFLIGAATVLISRQLVQKRIVALTDGVRKMREGRYCDSLVVRGNDEISQFTNAFNEMGGTIREREHEKDLLLKQLSDSFEAWQSTFDSINDLIAVCDNDGFAVIANRAYQAYFGLTATDLPLKHCMALIAGRDCNNDESPVCVTLRHQRMASEEIINIKSGNIFHVTTYPFRSSEVSDLGFILVARDVTERKRTEVSLMKSEATFRAIFDNSLDAIRVAKNGLHDYANPAYLELFNYATAAELSGQPVLDMIAPSERSRVEHIRKHRINGEEAPSTYETKGIRRDGTEFDVEVRVALFRVADDVFTVANIRDISDRKRHEEIIKHNIDTQRVINEALEIGLKNIPLEEILQATLEITLALPWLAVEAKGSIFLLDEAQKALVLKAKKGLAEDVGYNCTIVPLRKCLCGLAAMSQKVVFADSADERHEICPYCSAPHGHYCIPILSRGRTLGVLNLYLKSGYREDVKDVEFLEALARTLAGIIIRKRIEHERELLMKDLDNALYRVMRSQKEWVSTFDSITDMIALIDRNFTITRVNKAFANYYGMTPQEVLGKTCYELVHDLGEPIGICPHRETLEHHQTSSSEVVDHKRQRIFKTTTFPYYSQQGEIVGSIHISRDITEERDRELRLILSERLASLGQMASGIAHEINNPLAAIGGCAEGLLNRTKQGRIDPALFENYLGIIQEEVKRCKNITGGMLSIVRPAAREKRVLDLNDLLRKTIELVNFQGRLKNVEVIEHYAEAQPTLTGSEGELKQAFLSIITNALDAMNDSGVLTVETAVKDGQVTVSIGDTGTGISAQYLGRIFDPFFTLKSDKGGTGLGLSIANKIIVNHHGQISASSDEGKGATFVITFRTDQA
jgi:PAS domain S-box-containing protein